MVKGPLYLLYINVIKAVIVYYIIERREDWYYS